MEWAGIKLSYAALSLPADLKTLPWPGSSMINILILLYQSDVSPPSSRGSMIGLMGR
jgi:hypothetical protein